jgi:hypothetical protein
MLGSSRKICHLAVVGDLGISTMSTRTALAAVALMLAVTPALGAVVAEPPSDARAGGGVFEIGRASCRERV